MKQSTKSTPSSDRLQAENARLQLTVSRLERKIERLKGRGAQRLQASEERYRRLVDNFPGAVVVFDRDFRYQLAGGGVLSARYDLDDIVGRTLWEAFGPELGARFEPYYREALTGTEVSFDILDDDGNTFSITISPIPDGAGRTTSAIVVAHDITGRKHAEEALDRSERYFRALIENDPGAILVCDAEGLIRDKSPSLSRHFGFRPGELIGRNLFGLVHPDDLTHAREAFLRIRGSARPRPLPRCRFRRRDGAWRTVEGTWQDLLDDPAVQGIVANFRDVTAQLEAEEEKQELEEKLLQMQRMEIVGQLAGGVAHDFNNLLTSIFMSVDLGYQKMRKAVPLDGVLRAINEAAERARNLTRQLLAISRRQVLQPVSFDVNEQLGRLRPMLTQILGEDVRLSVELGADPPLIKADPGQIEQVILNLAINARDAMLSGGEIRIETDSFAADHGFRRLHPDLDSSYIIRIRVSDQGLGMSEEIRTRAFEPFFTTKPAGSGSGLGLTTVYGIIRQHGGTIEIESGEGDGTVVTILFPHQPENGAVALPAKHPDQELPRGHERILMVEDESGVLEPTADCLRELGYRVLTAADAETGLDLFLQHQDEVELLISDVVLPGMSGPEMARRMRVYRRGLKVLLTSGYSHDILATRNGGLADDVHFLTKPFNIHQVTHKIRKVLDGGGDPPSWQLGDLLPAPADRPGPDGGI